MGTQILILVNAYVVGATVAFPEVQLFCSNVWCYLPLFTLVLLWVRLKFSPSVANKLVILVLILFSISIFLPWVVQEYVFFIWSFPTSFKMVDLQFWSFMVRQNEKVLIFDGFWSPEPSGATPYYMPWNCLYLGWVLVFVLQILTVAYSIVYVLNLRVSEWFREHHSTWLVILPLLTVVFAFYQLFVQHEVMYPDLGVSMIRPDVGFEIALLSTAILLVAVFKAPEQSHLKAIPQALKRTIKKTWPALVLLLIVALPVVGELQFQTSVSKEMVVGSKDFQEIYANPALWEPHYKEISSLASFFRARITENSPEYAYCVLEAPVISYGILAMLLNGLGYWAEEDTPGHLCA